jgi:hypothetical protein
MSVESRALSTNQPVQARTSIMGGYEFAWLRFQPPVAWSAIIALVLVTGLCIGAGAGSVLRMVFPAMSLAVGLLLFQWYPKMYISYSWWLWFLTPLVRRLVDLQASYQEPSLILITPFLVSFLALLTLYKKLPQAYRHGGQPFILATVAIVYALIVGYISGQGQSMLIPLLKWSSPILLGFFLFSKWREYPEYSQIIRQTFLWMVVIAGSYGLYQYIVAPEWDTFWLTESGMTSSGGKAEPYGMRVFSTMNSTGPFANVMLAGLMLLFSSTGPLKLVASSVGYLSFFVTLVRSAWAAWALGLVILMSSLKPKLQMRLLLTICGMVICVLPLTLMEPFSNVIGDRLLSFTNLEEDTSYNGRSGIYSDILPTATKMLVGLGLAGAGKTYDSALVDSLLAFGWIGSIPYFSALCLIAFSLFRSQAARQDTFFSATKAIYLSSFFMLLFGSSMLELSGTILWGFGGIGLAANRYHQASSIADKSNF